MYHVVERLQWSVRSWFNAFMLRFKTLTILVLYFFSLFMRCSPREKYPNILIWDRNRNEINIRGNSYGKSDHYNFIKDENNCQTKLKFH